MSAPIMGTSIQDLNNSNDNFENYENIRKLQDLQNQAIQPNPNLFYQNHQNLQNLQSLQNVPNQNPNSCAVPVGQYTMPNEMSQAFINPQAPLNSNYSNINDADIEDLVKNINENLQDEKFTQVGENAEEKEAPEEKKWYDYFLSIPIWVKEVLIILIIYVILSQSFVKDFIGKYIKQINVDEEGKVSFTGVVIYGFILAILYVIFRRLLLG